MDSLTFQLALSPKDSPIDLMLLCLLHILRNNFKKSSGPILISFPIPNTTLVQNIIKFVDRPVILINKSQMDKPIQPIGGTIIVLNNEEKEILLQLHSLKNWKNAWNSFQRIIIILDDDGIDDNRLVSLVFEQIKKYKLLNAVILKGYQSSRQVNITNNLLLMD